MTTSATTSPLTTPRWEGFEDDDTRNPITSAPELFEYVKSKGDAIPTSHPPDDSRWLFIAIYAIEPGDSFLINFAKKFHEVGLSVLRETSNLANALETERDEYTTLRDRAQAHLDESRACKPMEKDLEEAVADTWQTYVARTKSSHRAEYREKCDSLRARIEEAARIEISEANKEFLHRRGYMNPFVMEGCLAGYDYQTHQAEVLLSKIERIWQERNEACAAFEVRWDRLKYTLNNRRVVPSDPVFNLWRKATGGYLAKEPERDRREIEAMSTPRCAKENPPEPYRWLDLAAEMWRLYSVSKRLQELEETEGAHAKEIAKCKTYEGFVMGQAEALATDEKLLARAHALRDQMTILHKNFALLCESMEGTQASIREAVDSKSSEGRDEGKLINIKTQTIPAHHASHHEHHATTCIMTREFLALMEELETYKSVYTPPTEVTQLGSSLEALGFITAEQLLREYAAMTTLRDKAEDWITSLNQGRSELEAKKHEARTWYDWLYATVERDFSEPWRAVFYGKRIIGGVTYISQDNPILPDDALPEIGVDDDKR